MAVQDLSAEQLSFLQTYLNVTLPGGAVRGDGAPPISLVKLGKARIEWGNARRAALAGVKSLEQVLEREYKDDPEASAALPDALKTLAGVMGRIASQLEDELDEVLNAEEADRARLAVGPAATAQDYIALCDSDPVLAALDGNEFTPDMKVTGPMKQSLSQVVTALG